MTSICVTQHRIGFKKNLAVVIFGSCIFFILLQAGAGAVMMDPAPSCCWLTRQPGEPENDPVRSGSPIDPGRDDTSDGRAGARPAIDYRFLGWETMEVE